MRPRLRIAAMLALGALAMACAGEPGLPPGVPTVPAPPLPPDAGEAFLSACAQAGCPHACEAVADGGVACGVVCGDGCSTLCARSRCALASGWTEAFCTNAGGASTWSPSADCDDGNPCTARDACTSGACVGAPEPTTTACDDGNVCTDNDHCDGRGGCVGDKITASPIHRFRNPSSPFNFGNGAPGFYSQFGYVDEGVIFYTSAAGDIDIYELHDSGSDRLISSGTTEGGYGFGAFAGSQSTDTRNLGRAFASNVGGTVPLLRYKFPAGSGHCTNDSECHFFTTDAASAPGGSTEERSGIFVCPP